MKRALVIGIVSLVVLSMLCVGVVTLGVIAFGPARAQAMRIIERAFDRVENNPRVGINEQEETVPEERQRLQREEGILVAGVLDGSPAAKAGLRRGDILLEVDGQPVNSMPQLRGALAGRDPGETVSLLVQRGESQRTVSLTVEESTNMATFLGIVPANPGMGGVVPFDRFEVQAGSGVRITEVTPGSPAEDAGLEVGDVILSLDGQTLDQATALPEALASHAPGDTVRLEVQSAEGETRTVNVELGENPDAEGRPWLGIRYVPAMNVGPQGEIPAPPQIPRQDPGQPVPGIPFPPGELTRGALIQEVTEGSPAAKAGLEVGQVIQSADGEELTTLEQLPEIIAGHEPGDRVTLTVVDPQTGEPEEVEVTLGENPDNPGSAWLGIRFSFTDIQMQFEGLPEE